jgi:hypothetical protein
MRELISRDAAERLIRESSPLCSQIEQTEKLININIYLSNGRILSVYYQPDMQNKQYLLISN